MAMLNANTYVTKEEGIGGTIRNRWEDFYVEEIPEVIPEGEGPNIYIWIEKLGRTTLDVLLDIARDLHIDRKRMGFAGMKDKKAITLKKINLHRKSNYLIKKCPGRDLNPGNGIRSPTCYPSYTTRA